jgi:hypothetical protein
MQVCKLCQKSEGMLETGVCVECSVKTGIRPMPPSRRQAIPCMRCNGMRFIRCMPREYSVELGTDHTYAQIGLMTLTQKPQITGALFGKHVQPDSVAHGTGTLETYVCVSCGYVEWYCQDPEAVPIGPEYNTQLVDYSPETPYRG